MRLSLLRALNGFGISAIMMFFSPAIIQAQVCSEGIGIPPFLDAGATPNLLLVMDNSGSMLDTAYIDDTTQCVDENFLKDEDGEDDPSIPYAGYFDRVDDEGNTVWYQWNANPDGVELGIPEWGSGACYQDEQIVYAEGGFSQASCPEPAGTAECPTGCTANRTYFSEGIGAANITWHSPAAKEWAAFDISLYSIGDFVRYDGQFYKLTGSNPTNAPPSADVTNTYWTPVDYTWEMGRAYSDNRAIVSYEGMLFRLKSGANLSATRADDVENYTIFDDTSGATFAWERFDEGYFDVIDIAEEACPATQTYSTADINITFTTDDVATYDYEAANGVSCFQATGNFLNWAASSKLDIQKKILTGGKYSAGYEVKVDGVVDNSVNNDTALNSNDGDTNDDRLIMESRGCAGKGFIKEVPLGVLLDNNGNAVLDADDNEIPLTLTFRTAGPQDGQKIDTDDYRTRIDILAVSDSGGLNTEYCDEVLNILGNPDNYDANGDLNSNTKGDLQDNTFGCLHGTTDPAEAGVDNTEMHEFDRSIMDCWQIARGQNPSASGTLKTHCEKIYDGSDEPGTPQQFPWLIGEYDPWYICSGEYDPSGLTKGTGYVGRCWAESIPDSGTGGNCGPLTCADSEAVLGEAIVEGGYWHDKNYLNYRCNNSEILICTNKKLTDCEISDYVPYLVDDDGNVCGVVDPDSRLCDDWDDDGEDDPLACWTLWELTPDPTDSEFIATQSIDDDGKFEWNTTGGGTDRCIEYAEWDWCQALALPEVIDPSDQVFQTTETFNIPASLVDAAVYTQLDVDKPLLSMAGYVKYNLPEGGLEDQLDDHLDRPDGPRSVLYEVAGDLRLGVMAFNDYGSHSECTGGDDGTVVPFCPPAGNKDGAQVISQIDIGKYVNLDGTENWEHYSDVIQAINGTDGVSWTPLAEAMYNAMGYYGHNPNLRLSNEISGYDPDAADPDPGENADFYVSTEEEDWPDPVQSWCQENHIIVITEGASTKDINDTVSAFVTANGDTDANDSSCPDGLDGSTYLDDMTYFGQNATVRLSTSTGSNLYTELLAVDPEDPDTEYAKSHITTHIITTGSLREDGEGECSPLTLMEDAADQGAAPSGLLRGENPDEVEGYLRATLMALLNRSSAGSAASVISSSRSGEGAVFQAVFWPQADRDGNILFQPGDDLYDYSEESPLTWFGDVHGLFIDHLGRMWDDYSNGATPDGIRLTEDTNGNGWLDPGEDVGFDPDNPTDNGCLDGDRRVFYYYDSGVTTGRAAGTRICLNDSPLEYGECYATDPSGQNRNSYCSTTGNDELIRDFDNFLWSAKQNLAEIADDGTNSSSSDILVNRPYEPVAEDAAPYPFGRWDWSGDSKQRYIFTWNDLNNDGIVDFDPDSNNYYEQEIMAIANSTWVPVDDDTNPSTPDIMSELVPTWTNYDTITTANGRGTILEDFQVATADELNLLFNWLRGSDYFTDHDSDSGTPDDYLYRCRKFPFCYNEDGTEADNPVWRLGDVIHSTPKLVAQPSEGFHNIYADPTYSFFVSRHRYRRHVVYFGANDGMLHAINAGFYHPQEDRFYKGLSIDVDTGVRTYSIDGPDYGDELWAYVPYNLQPHLKCLSDKAYSDESHKYFVDKEPRIFDMQIFDEEEACEGSIYDEDCIHPRGWGTVLVGAMRFGGAPIDAGSAGWGNNDNRKFVSSYFILDITDPERPPRLLGEMTQQTLAGLSTYVDLGYTVPTTTGVVMSDDKGQTHWYLLFGNGPTNLKGENTNATGGKIAVLPLAWLTGTAWTEDLPGGRDYEVGPPKLLREDASVRPQKAFRILDQLPAGTSWPDISVAGGGYSAADYSNQGGVFAVPGKTVQEEDADGDPVDVSVPQSFISDMITVDFTISTPVSTSGSEATSDLRLLGGLYETEAVYFGTTDGETFVGDDETVWPYGGRMFRLVMDDTSPPEDRARITPPGNWKIVKLIDAEGPITGAPSVGWDNSNFWIYFGTGRFFATEDKTDDTVQHFFGIKEPLNSSCNLTWAEVGFSDALNAGNTPGSRGLFRTDLIKVVESSDQTLLGDEQEINQLIFCDHATDCGTNLSYVDELTIPGDPEYDGLNATGLTYYSYNSLIDFIAGEERTYDADGIQECETDTGLGVDGWYNVLTSPRERVIGQSTLLGGLMTFTSYQPFDDLCTAEGLSSLYGVHYQTGTAWHENVFGLDDESYSDYSLGNPFEHDIVLDKMSLGRGLATTPSLHTGSGEGSPDAKAFVQTSTGEIIEINQQNLPIKPPRSGRVFWDDDQNPATVSD